MAAATVRRFYVGVNRGSGRSAPRRATRTMAAAFTEEGAARCTHNICRRKKNVVASCKKGKHVLIVNRVLAFYIMIVIAVVLI